jgi:predicted CoA-binding protein
MQEDMESLIEEFINLRTWVVVGASRERLKYGNRIFRNLTAAGYKVYGVNRHGGDIDGHSLYADLASLPEKPEVVDIVVPPEVTEKVVAECAELGLMRVWMQPGSESDAAIQFCHDHGIRVVHGACAMVRKRTWEN